VKSIYTGCCGFPCARSRYYKLFSVVELQNTFYDLPSVEWALSTRKEAPEGFKFVVKAWQVITHPHTSPTWKKMKKKPGGELTNYGFLKPTRENIEAFSKVLEIAKALDAEILVLQTPPSMPYNAESIAWIKKFFEEVSGLVNNKVLVGWEARGAWASAKELREILEKYDIIHVVDILRTRPVYKHSKGIMYIRLHGLGPGEVNYSYNYTDEDLRKLIEILSEEDFATAYVMFNNVKMLENGLRFKELLREAESFTVY